LLILIVYQGLKRLSMSFHEINNSGDVNQPLVVVLGMHRSGTSVVTRALRSVGVSLGDRLMPAIAGVNDKGFWEDLDIVNLNERLLSACGHVWHSVRSLKPGDVERLCEQGYLKEALQLLRKKSAPSQVFGFKDPRVAKLLPFWSRVFSVGRFDVHYVIALRNPISVADSLSRRDGFAPEKSYLMWVDHMLTILRETAESAYVMVDYDQIVTAPETALDRLASFLNTHINDLDKAEFLGEFLSEELRHSRYLPSDVAGDSAAIELAIEVYASVYEFAKNDVAVDVSILKQQLDCWDKELARIQPVLKYLDRLSQALTERDGQIACLSQAVTERDGQIASLTDETVRRGVWALGLDAELKEERAKVSALTMSHSWRITLPLREARRWISSPNAQGKRYTKEALRFAKRIYQSLPLSLQTKAKHRQWISKVAPRVLLATGAHPSTIPVFSIPQPSTGKATIQADPQDIENQSIHTAAISIVASDNPLVSVIIPIYGKVEYTLRCLASVAAHTPLAEFEVIVVDDCSPDNSFDALSQKVEGIRVLRNERNQGFIRSCNIGAKAAKGQYLYFLNNDTEVTEGWLDALLRTFSDFPGTGLAGSKLVYPDGRLQEAGGIIWQDGSAWNFGRFQDPQLPVYNYAREVDYCSGASIMVPKSLFEELGGFDEHYLPAYCEDSDLALKIRDKGYRVIYQPLSTVIHYEGITSGTDTTQGTKAYQIENSKKLFERWKQHLQFHQAPGNDVDNAKDRRATRRALVLDHCTPTPNQDAGSVTVFNLLLLLREMDFQVTFIPEDNLLYMPDYTTALQRSGTEVLYAPYVISVEQHLKEYGERYDLAFLFRPGVVERHVQTVRKYCPNAKVLFHTVDLHYLRMSREAQLQQGKAKQKAAEEMQQREFAAIRAADASIVHSTAEMEILKPLLPEARLHVFPLIMDIQGVRKTYQERRDIVFVGGYQHAPNVDAVRYFAEEVMPLLRKKLPGVRFHAVGSKPPAEIKALASEDIIITGFVEDLNPLLDKMRVSVAPLRYGAGIKGKIGAAMAVGLPVVATSLAVEGMSLTDGENILVADGPEAFANAVAMVYHDEALWTSISRNGLAFADRAWGAEAAWKILSAILKDLRIQVKRGLQPLSLYTEPVTAQKKNTQLLPVGSVKCKQDYLHLLEDAVLQQIARMEKQLLAQTTTEAFAVDGFCVPCDKNVAFLVDMQSGGQRREHGWIPNWRERLECPLCRMNNRQRLMATLVKQALSAKPAQHVYFMEQVTPIFNWAKTTFTLHQIYGSEYLGYEYVGGTIVKGIRHEDVENLSFAQESLDLIISNDVFEHVPNPPQAFAECARVLKPGGVMLATIPFHRNNDLSVIRARLSDGKLEHILPPAFHGNPVSADGSLVFTDFGWDLLDTIKLAGFRDVSIDIYAALEFGHLGGGQLVFRCVK
jgi:GT2 family glycosyltransferase/glycosyltransferase involved in cell wall biosynthesis